MRLRRAAGLWAIFCLVSGSAFCAQNTEKGRQAVEEYREQLRKSAAQPADETGKQGSSAARLNRKKTKLLAEEKVKRERIKKLPAAEREAAERKHRQEEAERRNQFRR